MRGLRLQPGHQVARQGHQRLALGLAAFAFRTQAPQRAQVAVFLQLGAVVDTQARTVTVPAGGSVQFLRLSSASPITVTSVSLSGGSLVIRYQ